MSNKKLPDVPEEFQGKEPSLNELNIFIEEHGDLFTDPEKLKTIAYYIQITNSSYSEGFFWLFGQLKITPSDAITNIKLQEAIDLNNKQINNYGGGCNSFENASIKQANNHFVNLLEILCNYYSIKLHIEYAPGGDGYIRAETSFNKRNK